MLVAGISEQLTIISSREGKSRSTNSAGKLNLRVTQGTLLIREKQREGNMGGPLRRQASS